MCRDIDCGCEQHGRHAKGDRGTHHSDCCCMPGYGRRRFHTREEVIAELEEYLGDLRSEIKGVEERIAQLKKEA